MLQADDSGAWLWCSKEDMVIDAIRKVGGLAGLAAAPAVCAWCIACRAPSRVWLAGRGWYPGLQFHGAPHATPAPFLSFPQMTHANVGSLVVFDPSKVTVDKNASKVINANKDAVVGIMTERGERGWGLEGWSGGDDGRLLGRGGQARRGWHSLGCAPAGRSGL